MIRRTLETKLKEAAHHFPVVTLTGPRQSGKTTLVKEVFKNYAYQNLELPDVRMFAVEDPRGFLDQFKGPVILDEIQRTPELFSYIQVEVDKKGGKPGQFILTGSQNFLMMQSISQSLAGRCAVLHLLPFSLSELLNRDPFPLNHIGKKLPECSKPANINLWETLFTGFYPRIHDKKIPPRSWLSSYYMTYVERDVRNIINIGDIDAFGRFIRLCAGRCGQIVNLSSLGSDCGVSHTTVKRWLSVLEASFIIIFLRPHYKNFGKRLIKSPKLYFLDTGLLCYLLQITSESEIFHRAERGAIFESFVISEIYKNFVHMGDQPNIYFWRDRKGHEVDMIIDRGTELIPVEIKSAQTIASDFFLNLNYWLQLSGDPDGAAALIYGGDEAFVRSGVCVYPWWAL